MRSGLPQITSVTSSLIGCVALALPLHPQSSLPNTAPTAITASQLPSATPSLPQANAVVQWDGRLLRITASGQPLAEIFREVAARTGMRVSGNVPTDPVFGSYGPTPLFDVLTELVSGLPVNMLFVERAGSKPAQLTFTARNGAASSPSVSSASQPYAQQPSPYQTYPAQQSNVAPSSSTTAPNPGFGNPSAAETPGSASQSSDGTSNPTSPSGVKTPQEIFEQLQRMRANSSAPR